MATFLRRRSAGLIRPTAIVAPGVSVTGRGGFLSLFRTVVSLFHTVVLAGHGHRSREITTASARTAATGTAGAGFSGRVARRVSLRGALRPSAGSTATCAYAASAARGPAAPGLVAAVLGMGVQASGPVAQTVVGNGAAAATASVTPSPSALPASSAERRGGAEAGEPGGPRGKQGRQTGAFALSMPHSGENGQLRRWLPTLNALVVTFFKAPMTRAAGRRQRRTTAGMAPRASAEATP
ncbi:hypothetical protein [Streptomyces enissocaesilis]|uniref:Uncharacterized protein n=1 Tax=Streptomyces enissocaesilis TaxID=332589 RepID=A0ABN3X1P7_9ACTN